MKKLFSIILATAVAASGVSAFAKFNDTENHWASSAIDAWSDYGVISGYDGNFAPDRQITRGEFSVVLNRLMNYKTLAENNFSDLDQNFYTDAILKLNAKGVISGYNGTVNPGGHLTREEAAVMLCKALEIETEQDLEREFDDAGNISDWAKPYVCALVNRGLLNGYAGKLNPKNTITRAEVVTILNNAVLPVLTSGEITGETIDNILVISAPDVVVSNYVTNGNIIITEGVDAGTVVFKDSKINGYLKINNDRDSFVKLENTTVAYESDLENNAIIAGSNATVDKSEATGGKPQVSTGGGGGGGGGASKPKPTASPAPTNSPEPTTSPAPTTSPEPTTSPTTTPSASPEPTTTPAPTESPKPTTTPEPTTTPAPTTPPEPDIDYGAENAEVVANIEDACDDIALYLDRSNQDYYGVFDPAERKMLTQIRTSMLDSLTYKDKNLIDAKFIKKTYKSEIESVEAIYDSLGEDGQGSFLEKIAINLQVATIEWLAAFFGLLD